MKPAYYLSAVIKQNSIKYMQTIGILGIGKLGICFALNLLTLTVQRDNSLIISEIRNWCLSFVVATFFIKGFIFATLCLSLRYVY